MTVAFQGRRGEKPSGKYSDNEEDMSPETPGWDEMYFKAADLKVKKFAAIARVEALSPESCVLSEMLIDEKIAATSSMKSTPLILSPNP